MFNSNPTVLIYIKRSSLLFYDGQSVMKLPLPEDIVSDLEVLDQAKLAATCEQFFSDKAHGKRALVTLDGSIVFDKIVPLAAQADPGPLANAFRTSVPFEPDNCSFLSVHKEDKLYLYAANRVAYETVMQAVIKVGLKVAGVTPFSAYKLSVDADSDKKIAKAILDDPSVLHWANFVAN